MLTLSFQRLQNTALFNFVLDSIGYLSVVQITKSSAKSAFDTLRCFVKSLMYTRNRVQLRADPWGRPSSSVLLDDVAPSHLVAIVLLVKNPWIHLSIFP